LQLETTPGVGSRFTISLPVGVADTKKNN
jgi:chemotaxis protein histidine kinase CheA